MTVDQARDDDHAPSVDPRHALLVLCDTFDDLEAARIAAENRYRSLTTDELVGERGGSFGKGVPTDEPTARSVEGLVLALRDLEEKAKRDIKRVFRTHPLYGWADRTVGVGDVQGARLLAALGDPLWNDRDDRPRRDLSELQAYCGYHVLRLDHEAGDIHASTVEADPSGSDTDQSRYGDQGRPVGVAPVPHRGQRVNWNPTVKKRLYLIAKSVVKTGVRRLADCDDTDGYDLANREAISPYGQLYLDARKHYAGSVHPAPCYRCGPKGRPASAGSVRSRGHQEACALRLVVKNGVLTDLWNEARRVSRAA